MFGVSRRKIKTKPIGEENDDDKAAIAAKKGKLLTEIRALKLLITQAECNLNPTRFKDLSREENVETPETSTAGGSQELSDVDAKFQNELCSYAGFCCQKMEDQFLVTFQSLHGSWFTNENWIELLRDDKHYWKLGQWIMPFGIDAEAIFANYSMNSSSDVKVFLRECKHLIDCHNHREQEFKKLEVFMSHMQRYGYSVESNCGYTAVTMKLVKKHRESPDSACNILVYLIYNKDTARPSKILIDCEGDNILSHENKKELNRIFSCFKELDLIDAAKQTFASPESEFVWKDSSIDDSKIEIMGDEEDNKETSFSRLLQQKSKVAKKRGRVENKVVDESANDDREKDLSIDAVDASDPEAYEDEVPQEIDRSKKQKRVTVKKKTEPIKSRSRVKKINAAEKTKNGENIPVVKLFDNSEISRASVKENLPLNDCNDNIVSSYFRNVPIKTAEKRPENKDKVESTVPKSKNTSSSRSSALPAGANEKSTEKRKSIAEVEGIEIRRKKSRSNGDNSVSMPNGRSLDVLLCSTPITECVATLSMIAEENISAIATEQPINSRNIVDDEKNERANYVYRFVSCDSEDSDEKDTTQDYDNHAALLKDLQAVKYNNNATDKTATKSVKRKMKFPSRGRNKISKK